MTPQTHDSKSAVCIDAMGQLKLLSHAHTGTVSNQGMTNHCVLMIVNEIHTHSKVALFFFST